MFYLAKHNGIQSIFCDFRHATTSLFGILSRFSQFMPRPVWCLPRNYSLVHKTRNLPENSESKFAWNKSRPYPSMSSPNFRLSGASLGYWTACNNFKRHCTLPYCDFVLIRAYGTLVVRLAEDNWVMQVWCVHERLTMSQRVNDEIVNDRQMVRLPCDTHMIVYQEAVEANITRSSGAVSVSQELRYLGKTYGIQISTMIVKVT